MRNGTRWGGLGLALGFAVVLGLAGGGPARAQDAKAGDPKGLVGSWNGTLKPAPQVSLRLVFTFKQGADGKLSAVMVSPDQTSTEIPVDAVTLDGNKVSLAIPAIQGKYEGTWDAAKKTIDGQWTQLTSKLPLTLVPGDVKAMAEDAPAGLLGLWEGKLMVGGASLRLVLRVEEKDGKRTAVLDSLDQGVNGIPLTAVKLDGDKVSFESKGIAAMYEGRLDKEKGLITGTWTQAGQSWPLELKKTEKVSEVRRPQHPKPPFDYQVAEATYPGKEAGVSLAGTLTVPKGEGPFPAVVLITGSGPQDRDETLLGHKPFLVLADFLTRHGVAVLRADDRGVGGSKGPSVMNSTSEELAGDALAGVEFLKKDSRIDPKRIGLVGHSEGGLIAPIAATRSDDVAFIVLLAGTGINGEAVLLGQTAVIAKAAGASEEALAKQAEALGRLIAIIKAEPDAEAAQKRLEAATEDLLALEDEKKDAGAANAKVEPKAAGGSATVAALARQLNNKWFRYFLTYEPKSSLERVRCPVLAVNGELDLQVLPKDNLPKIEEALRSGGNADFTIVEFPGLNHLFQHAKTGSPAEYAGIEETMSTDVLDRVTSWILERKPRS